MSAPAKFGQTGQRIDWGARKKKTLAKTYGRTRQARKKIGKPDRPHSRYVVASPPKKYFAEQAEEQDIEGGNVEKMGKKQQKNEAKTNSTSRKFRHGI